MPDPQSPNHQITKSPNPYLTADLPGIGGVLKERPEDFLVEEQPLYEPSGEGEHLVVFIEKRQATTTDAARWIGKAFGVGRGSVAFAGLKDKHAVTRQHFSVHMPGGTPEADAEGAAKLVHYDKLKLLWSARHGNKLRRGHHGGNRFVIRVRQVEPTAVIRAKPILDALLRAGAPNYVGEQRFGHRNNTQDVGRLLILGQHQAMLDEMLGRSVEDEHPKAQQARALYRAGDYREAQAIWPKSLRFDRQALDALIKGKPPDAAVRAIDAAQRGFMMSAFQSAVFNDVLARRIADGTYDRLVPGDLAWKHDSRAVFAVDGATAETENAPDGRVASFEVSPSGPMWGLDMTRAAGGVDAAEVAALEAAGLTVDQLAGADGATPEGARRPMRVPIKDADLSGGVDEHGPYVRLGFELPRGAYATSVMAEIMKA